MNDPDFSPDDPKLTAFALGELEGDERAAVEAAVRADPALRTAVEEIRTTALHIQAALAAEAATPVDATSATGQETVVAYPTGDRAEERDEDADTYPPRRPGTLIKFPQFYYIAGGLAAAAFAVMVALNRDEYRVREQARAEALRVAFEQQAAERRLAQPATMLVQSAPETKGRPETGLTHAPADAGARATGFAPANLALLEQVKRTGRDARASEPGEEAAPQIAAAGGSTGSLLLEIGTAEKAHGGLTQARPAAAVATASPGVGSNRGGANAGASEATPARTPTVAEAEARGQNTDTRYAVGAATDLVPEPQRVFVAPATAAAPTGGYAATAANSEVVTLDAFTVSAERAGSLAAAQRSNYDPDAEEREYRPRAPVGARFARSPSRDVRDNDFMRAVFHPLSTFAVDTDAASYVSVRRMIARGELPPRELVKIEELLNYFPYRYPVPAPSRSLSFLERLGGEDPAPPFAAALEVAEAPWAPAHRLVRIGLKGREIASGERPGANLVFLVDVSASMNEPNRLPLVKESLRLLLAKLRGDDRVAIATYGGDSGLVLASTPVARTREIMAAIDALTPRDPAPGVGGIRLAYEVARQNFAEDGINRVILCTDGDFSLGTATEAELLSFVQEKAGTGVFLTVLGFGMGNYKDATLETLAERGNGSYGYIDSRREAQKLLVEQVSSTLVTIAKDVKIQVEFNPAKVSSYRLIGYENRLLRREDFNTEDVNAGEIGAGHTITALYEIVPVGMERPVNAAAARRDDLRYVNHATEDAFSARLAPPMRGAEVSEELLTVKVRYKKPDGLFSRTSEFSMKDPGSKFAQATPDFRFAAAVAQFGMILRNSPYKGEATIGDVIAWAAAAAANPADDPGGYRGEFIDLARQTQEILRTE